MDHKFTVEGSWNGGLQGKGTISSGNLRSEVSGPTALGGPGVGTNPEELLFCAAATCYLITLGAILERRKLPIKSLHMSTEGTVSADGPLKITSIVHRPVLTVGAVTEEQKKTANDAFPRAERACLVSNAIRGNVTVTVEPTLNVE